jgi:hypothetical protein
MLQAEHVAFGIVGGSGGLVHIQHDGILLSFRVLGRNLIRGCGKSLAMAAD